MISANCAAPACRCADRAQSAAAIREPADSDFIAVRRNVLFGDGSLARDAACTDGSHDIFEQGQLRVCDRHRQATVLSRVTRRNGPSPWSAPTPTRSRVAPRISPGSATIGGAGGTAFHPFRDGLDYAFILHRLRDGSDAGRVIRDFSSQILVPAPPPARLSQSMSLYRAGQVGLVPPLGVAMSLSATQGSPNEPRLHFAFSGEGDHCVPLHQSNPRPQALDFRIYARSCLFVFSPHATRAAGKTLGQRRCLLTMHPVARCIAIL